jgi:hypothetical protein
MPKTKPSNQPARRVLLAGYLLYSAALKMEVIYSCVTAVGIYQTTRSYIAEDRTLHSHHCEDLKSNSMYLAQEKLLAE